MSENAYLTLYVLISALVLIGMFVLLYLAIKYGGTNNPTWKGIIISAIFGLLPLYLILCFFGVMGEERYDE